MDRQKAVIKFRDGQGRAVLLTERNEAVVIQNTRGPWAEGDKVEIERPSGKRRSTDWRIVE